jgi:hypothetical protein
MTSMLSVPTTWRNSRNILLRHTATAFAVFCTLYLYSNIGAFAMDHYGTVFKLSYLYVLIVVFGLFVLTTSGAGLSLLRRHYRFIGILLLFLVILASYWVLTPGTMSRDQAIISDAEFVLATIAFLAILSVSDLKVVLIAFGAVTLLSVAINFIEYFQPSLLAIGLRTATGRAGGFYVNPNGAATFICLPIPVLAFFLSRPRRYAVYAVTLAGIIFTFSRGGAVLWLAAVFMTEWMRQWTTTKNRLAATGATAIQLAIAATLAILLLPFAISTLADALAPLLNTNTRARLTSGGLSDSGRLYLAWQGLKAFFDSPLFGKGIGYTRDWVYVLSVHNMFVLMLAEMGLIGGAWIGAFLVSLVRYGAPFGLLIASLFFVSSMFTHNSLQQPQFGMIIALYLVLAQTFDAEYTARQRGKAPARVPSPTVKPPAVAVRP